MKKLLFNYILPPILWCVIHLCCVTLRIRTLNPEMENEVRTKLGKAILTCWHSRLLYLFYHFRGLKRYTLLISPSVDGDLLANLCRWFGYNVVRASSFKNTFAGSRELVDLLNRDCIVVLIADGSRGPRHQAQAGALQLARITGAPVYPLSFDAQPKYELNGWDRMVLPLPFARATLNLGPSLTVPPDADKQEVSRKQAELNQSLNRITETCTAR